MYAPGIQQVVTYYLQPKDHKSSPDDGISATSVDSSLEA